MMRIVACVTLALMLSACQTAVEKQAGSVTKDDCRRQAARYVQSNLASIPNEKRELERYNQYKLCLARRAN